MTGKNQLVVTEDCGDGIVRLLFNDPATRNAMSEAMAEQFAVAIGQLCVRDDLRVVVLSGAGKAFSAGGHLDMLEKKIAQDEKRNRAEMREFYEQFLCIRDLPVPTVAAINGHAMGAGLCVALCCDVRIARSGSKLGLNFVRLGLHPGMGVTYTLPRIVGPAKAAELLYAGSVLSAEDALEIGLVNRCAAADAFEDHVKQYVDSVATAGPQAVRMLKRTLKATTQGTLSECLEYEALAQARDYLGDEFKEGITAAKERRKPRF